MRGSPARRSHFKKPCMAPHTSKTVTLTLISKNHAWHPSWHEISWDWVRKLNQVPQYGTSDKTLSHSYLLARFWCLPLPSPPSSATPGPPLSSLWKAGGLWWGSCYRIQVPQANLQPTSQKGNLTSPTYMPNIYIYFLQVHSEWGKEELRVSSESSVDEVTKAQILISITRVKTILGKN